MGAIKERNGMDLTEAEEIKKRWQEYPEGLSPKIQITTMKWALSWSQISWSVKSSGLRKHHYEQS